jgi:thiol:disulfide interchange protein DsbC
MKFIPALILSFFAVSLHAQTLPAAPEKVAPAVEKTVRGAVESWLKGQFKVSSISKTPMPGIVEVRIADDIFYADDKGNFAIIEGQMIDLKTGANLTVQRMEDITRIDFSKLPLDLAIKTVKGNGQRVIAVFEDPYCSFCRTFRKTLLDTPNATIYTFLFPMLRPESETVAKNAWCAKNRADVWDDWMLLGKEPPKADAKCNFQTARLLELGRGLNVTGTPTTFLSDGRRFQGAVSRERLDQALGSLK